MIGARCVNWQPMRIRSRPRNECESTIDQTRGIRSIRRAIQNCRARATFIIISVSFSIIILQRKCFLFILVLSLNVVICRFTSSFPRKWLKYHNKSVARSISLAPAVTGCARAFFAVIASYKAYSRSVFEYAPRPRCLLPSGHMAAQSK